MPTTVVAAIEGEISVPLAGEEPVKLTAEALAKNNQALLASNDLNKNAVTGVDEDIFGIVEVSSNLSRSSSESGYLKNLYKGNPNGNISNINGSNNNSNTSRSSAAATPAHYQPFGEDVSSLGSLAEDVLPPHGAGWGTAAGYRNPYCPDDHPPHGAGHGAVPVQE